MRVRIIKAEDMQTTRWSGGTTTQVYIYPEDAVYAERNFLFRLSMANAEVRDSVYTQLDGVTRYLVSLDGESEIVHEKRKVHLAPFGDVDCFSGDEHTEAHGAIRDFNLMLKGSARGDMVVVRDDETVIDKDYTFYALYTDVDAQVKLDEIEYHLKKGECLLIEDAGHEARLRICGELKAVLCRVR